MYLNVFNGACTLLRGGKKGKGRGVKGMERAGEGKGGEVAPIGESGSASGK